MRRLLSVVAVLLLGVGLAACGDDDDDASPTVGSSEEASTTTAAPADEEDETTTTAAADEPAAGDATVAVGESPLGPILVDGAGMTLYLFTQDPAGGDSACTGGCASAWQALLVDGEPVAGEGVDAALLGTASHPDGQQVTYNGHRLYLYANDAAPGDTTGQAVGDVWYVVSTTGEAIS